MSRSSISPFRSRRSSPSPSPSSSSTRRSTPIPSSSLKPKPPSVSPNLTPSSLNNLHLDLTKVKENVTVTVRFRPLSGREISKGDEVAWYADGDQSLRNEYNTSIAYSFDRVFGPATTTRHVYDVAAQHVVNGVMEGINGTVFAYGVTSSGKTHTMHGEQKSPGIIPLAVKDVFAIIQETPGREFLLRVSYLEIYNEVINDLLNPTGQNLRIREDAQGIYVEGIKEEVVLSSAHALSLIASGEEHRHVGSNNFNLLSSRSHTIFTLTIESSPRGEDQEEEVKLSHLHLIDLAGSESSKTETTGLRRKEGSYINKSLLTLGTVISKLTDGKSTHIPYRDSKLTRLLQSSLSGHGRISLICTVTPSSSNSEETHNTLKFAHRSKHMEVKAFQNKILDEKSLIKKYQKEIYVLKEELQQLRQGMMENQIVMAPTQEDLVNLKLQLEAGQVKLQSRLEEEEQAKAALMGRIQKLTKLILVSTKSSMHHSTRQKSSHRRRHSFGEDELAYLPDRRHGHMIDNDAVSINSELSNEGRSDVTNLDELVSDYKRNRRRGMLDWFKLKKPDQSPGFSRSADNESSTSASPASSLKSLDDRVVFSDMKGGQRISTTRRGGDATTASERTQAGELFTAAAGARHLPPSGTTIIDQMDLLQEQVKMLAGEVALCTSSLKRLSEQAMKNPDDAQLKENMQRLKDDIKEKKMQMRKLEQRMIGSVDMSSHATNSGEIYQALSKLASQLNEKTFELEIKSADNRVLQDQLQTKTSENAEMQETIMLLRQQLDSLTSNLSLRVHPTGAENVIPIHATYSEEPHMRNLKVEMSSSDEVLTGENTPTSVMHLNRVFSCEDSKYSHSDAYLKSHLLVQAAEIESLKQEKLKIAEEKDRLEIHHEKLAEEASYAKELAAAAAVELRNLAEEVTKLSYQNAKLTADVAAAREASCRANRSQRPVSDVKQNVYNDSQLEDRLSIEELEEELNARKQREMTLVAALSERDNIEYELRKRLDEAKRREKDLESDIADMWVLHSKMRKSDSRAEGNFLEGSDLASVPQTRIMSRVTSCNGNSEVKHENETNDNLDGSNTIEELSDQYTKERLRCKELETLVSQLKGDNIGGLDTNALEELQKFHVEAITKICHAKCLYML